MKYKRHRYRINRRANELTHTHVVSNRRVGLIDEAELQALLSNDQLLVFINSTGDELEPVARETHHQMFVDEWSQHITTSGDADVSDFERGYYFYAERWKGEEGKPVVVLLLQH